MLMLLAQISWAQFELKGKVTDSVSKKGIASTQIYIEELKKLVDTDKDGNFQFKDIPSGKYTLVVFSYQYETLATQIELSKNQTLEFELSELTTELSEVVINQKKEEIFGLKRLQPVEGTAIYAGKKSEVILLDQMVGNRASNNARQVYSQVVGLNIYESNDGGLQLSIGGRGLDPNRTSNFNTRQNGYDISADVLGYPESYYTPPVEGLEEIEVIRGAASLQYGTQFGGLINFKMKKPVADKKIELKSRQTIGSFGLYTSFNSLSGTVGKFSYYTYFNYKQGNGYRPNSEFDSKNLFANVRYAFSDETSITADFTYLKYLAQQAGGLTDSQFADDPMFSNRERNWFEVDWKLYAIRLDHKFSNRTDFSLNVFGLNAERNALGFRGIPGLGGLNRNPVSEPDWKDEQGNYIYPRDLIKGTFNNWGIEARLLTRYGLFNRDAVLLVGSKYYHAENGSIQGQGADGSSADFSFHNSLSDYPNNSNYIFPNRNLAFFGENIIYLNDHFSITPGIRVEHILTRSKGTYLVNSLGSSAVDTDSTESLSLPRTFVLFGLGLSNEFNPNLELYWNFSQNYRSVTFSDIRTVNPSFIIDENIQDENGYTSDIGLRGKWKKYVSYDVGAYVMMYKDRIGIVFDDRANRVRTNIGDAMIYGLEFFVDWNLIETFQGDNKKMKFNWFVNAAFTGSRYLNSIEGNNNVDGHKVEFIPDVNIKTGLNMGYKNLLSSIQFTSLSKQFTDAENSNVAESGSAREGVIGEIPAYYIVDFSLSYAYKMLKLETGINNLTDNNYFTRRATGYPGPGIIPSDGRSFYLTLGIKL
ncbi:Fe(3+) dicitrate transport protein [Reichenbachiella faecimaris]|uniref:Fe(3+) dicitrate transport protein n=2 Tax=Reichenbachiella faecimaris TaxID=692418 RepID=A0A1W2G5D1_REIFA|nr:Fe(3+) dicitrate transport protein [Reichenbachiella faecimaris]